MLVLKYLLSVLEARELPPQARLCFRFGPSECGTQPGDGFSSLGELLFYLEQACELGRGLVRCGGATEGPLQGAEFGMGPPQVADSSALNEGGVRLPEGQ